MAENTFQSPQGSGDNRRTDSILDIFTSEDIEESAISRLSKDLNDVNIDSLLAQTKKVAEEIKWGH